MEIQESCDVREGALAETGDVDSRRWVLAKCLLSANDRTSALLEQLLLDAFEQSNGGIDVEDVVREIDRALDEHERAMEELELARAKAMELES